MIKIEPALKALTGNNVSFVVVGGVAVSAHGSAYITQDLDFCYERTPENLKRIVAALLPFDPRPRNFPEDLPFFFDERTLQNETNFTFVTDLGDIDLLGGVSGIGAYQNVEESSVVMNLYDCEVRVLSIDGLIKAKRAAGRTNGI